MNPKKFSFVLLLAALFSAVPQGDAVQNHTAGTYNNTAPTDADVPGWTTGWAQPAGQTGVTGWDYVGTAGPAAAVYLGNNWVLTAGHLGITDGNTFTLGGHSYSIVAGSVRGITDLSNGTADITLFRISTAPNLPPLTLASSAPAPFSPTQAGGQVVMMGLGGGPGGPTWGYNTVTDRDLLVQPDGTNFSTMDFETAFGTTTFGTRSVTNDYTLIVGDSGGPDFIYNTATSQWELAGINEANDSQANSYMVQLGNYAAQINAIVGTPEFSTEVQAQIEGAVAVSWATQPGALYQVQYTEDLSAPSWTNIGTTVVGNGVTNYFYDTTNGKAKRFYRVMTQ